MQLTPLLDAFILRRQVVIPYLLAFLLVSPATLKEWIAIQHSVDVPPVARATPEWKMSKRKTTVIAIISGALLYPAIHAAYYIGWDTIELFVLLISVVLAMLYTQMLTSMTVNTTQRFRKWAIFRNPSGAPVRVAPPTGRLTKVATHICSAIPPVIVVLLVQQEAEAAVIIAATAIAFLLIRQFSSNFSMGTYYKCAMAYTCFSLCIALILIARDIIAFYRDTAPAIDVTPTELETSKGSVVVSTIGSHMWTSWGLPAFEAYIPGALIAACLRFDYNNYFNSQPEKPLSFALETVPRPQSGGGAPKETSIVGETGIVIPTSLPRFAPIYFCSALLFWALGFGGLLIVEAYTSVVFKSNKIYSSNAIAVTLPLMCVGLWVLALIRRESTQFWTYREVWDLSTKKSVDTTSITDSVTSKVEEV